MADSRMDLILKKLNGEDVELVPPMSRIEKIYFKMLGYDIELDPPQSRSEELLTEYVNSGGGGGGSSDFSTINVTLISAETGGATIDIYGLKWDNDKGLYYTENVAYIGLDVQSVVVPYLAYKGKATINLWTWFNNLDEWYEPVVTGDITYDAETYDFTITGEGSITLKPGGIM